LNANPFRSKASSVGPDEVKVRAGSNEFVGRIKNIADGAVQLLLPVALLVESNVTVVFGADCALEGTVLYCNHQDEIFCAGIYFSQNRKRRVRDQTRHAIAEEKVEITVLREGGGVSLTGWIVDISASGLGLKLTSEVSPGAWVKITRKSAIMFGEIRHCSADPNGGFRAGLQIETSLSRNSAEETDEKANETIYHLNDPK
jgi:hypothetical protein